MTIPYVESTGRNSVSEHRTNPRLSRFLGWLGALIAELGKWGDIRATQITLDDMSEAQLEEIGIRRITRRVRWLDCRESPLSMDCEYRGALEDGRRDGDLHV